MTYCYLIHVKIFPARQDGMWYDYPLCGPDKCYIASFTTEARVQYVLCVPCEGYGCRGGRPGGGRERERHPPELLSSALLSVPVYCTVQADTAGDGEEWGTVRPRPETSGWHQTVSVALCPGPRSSVWLRLWQDVTGPVLQVIRRTDWPGCHQKFINTIHSQFQYTIMFRKEKISWVSLVETNVKSENFFNMQKALCVMHYARCIALHE